MASYSYPNVTCEGHGDSLDAADWCSKNEIENTLLLWLKIGLAESEGRVNEAIL